MLSEPRRRRSVPSSTTVHSSDGHALADAARERRGALAVEVALEPVADGLVQQDAGPAGAEHHGHGAGRRRHRLEIHQRLAHGLARERERLVAVTSSGSVMRPPAPA